MERKFKPEIKWVKTHEDAILPARSHKDPLTGDVGYDIFATEDIAIPPRGSIIIVVGLTVAYITPGYWFRIEPRSGNGFGKDIIPFLGVIDNSYRNNLGVKLYNHSPHWQHIEKGKGVAQLIVYEMIETKMSWADGIVPVEEGARGTDAFGSTDGQLFECINCNKKAAMVIKSIRGFDKSSMPIDVDQLKCSNCGSEWAE